jgi:hypothetical protein
MRIIQQIASVYFALMATFLVIWAPSSAAPDLFVWLAVAFILGSIALLIQETL